MHKHQPAKVVSALKTHVWVLDVFWDGQCHLILNPEPLSFGEVHLNETGVCGRAMCIVVWLTSQL